MQENNAIEVRDLTKKFKVYIDKGSSLKERILFRKRNKYEERWVLNGISFDVKKGEAIGLIGHNGCGKSTTLKLLSKIIYPDSGSIEMKGRVSSLIELGAGFHPDMSGRENIYTNAAIFGLSRQEIDRRLEDIIKFSELQEYIDNPVRTYSSGMYMRLAFSVAINVDADILLVDEILAVGDAHFQEKCFNKLKEIKKQGTTIVIVSHSLGQIEEICERTIWIDQGKIAAQGAPFVVHPQYLEYMNVEVDRSSYAKNKGNAKKEYDQRKNLQMLDARMNQIRFWDAEGNMSELLTDKRAGKIEFEYALNREQRNAKFGFDVRPDGWTRVYGTDIYAGENNEFSLDMRESDFLFYLSAITQERENMIDVMQINENCERIDEKIIIHRLGNMWGPYISMEPIPHRLEIQVDYSGEKTVILTITGECGEKQLGQHVLNKGKNKIPINTSERIDNVEFVINNPDTGDIIIEQISCS